MAKFQIYKDKANQYRFRLKASNGEIVATGEGYTSKQSVQKAIQFIKINAPKAEIQDLTIAKRLFPSASKKSLPRILPFGRYQ